MIMEHNENNYTKAQMELITLNKRIKVELNAWIKNLLGKHWTVSSMSYSHVCFSAFNADKKEFVFGQNIDIYFNNETDFEEERFECNIGTTGSFNPLSGNIGDRARFYIDFGRFLSSDLDWLKNFLLEFNKERWSIRDRISKGE